MVSSGHSPGGSASARRASVRTAAVWAALQTELDSRPTPLQVIDAGGGTGGFAVPLARLGHEVTVVDPSPDSLAALERRASEAGVAHRVRAVQGDLASLPDLAAVLPAGGADLVLVHSVLEVVDDPTEALAGVVGVLAPDGLVSILVTQRAAAVVARALAGHPVEALRMLHDDDGRWGPGDTLARRFSPTELTTLVTAAGLRPQALHGVRIVADLLGGPVAESDPDAVEALLDLELALASRPEYLPAAGRLHLLATRA